jgi:hypothetical protein
MVSTLSPVLWATLPIFIDYSLIISIKSGVYSTFHVGRAHGSHGYGRRRYDTLEVPS